MKESGTVLAALLVSGFILMCSSFVRAEEVPRITKEETVKLLGNADVIIIDVRQATDWKLSREKIKGSVREDPEEIDSWMARYSKDKILIFY
jgi:rhodanese-related sulfurtransferase